MYSVVYPELNFDKFPGMVPEWFRNQFLMDFLEWFRNGSGIQFWWIFWNSSGMVTETFLIASSLRRHFPVALSAKICVFLSVVLINFFRGPSKC